MGDYFLRGIHLGLVHRHLLTSLRKRFWRFSQCLFTLLFVARGKENVAKVKVTYKSTAEWVFYVVVVF